MANLTYPQIYALATNAGFSGQSANTITAIALAESGGNPYAVNAADPGGSYGITQINGAAHGSATALSAYGNPQTAMDLAYQISKGGQDFSAWSSYNSGAYKQYLAANTTSSAAASGASGYTLPNPLGAGAGDQIPTTTGSPGTGGAGQPAAVTGATPPSAGSVASSILSSVETWLGSIGGNLGIAVLAIVLFLIAVWPVAKPVVVQATRAAAEG